MVQGCFVMSALWLWQIHGCCERGFLFVLTFWFFSSCCFLCSLESQPPKCPDFAQTLRAPLRPAVRRPLEEARKISCFFFFFFFFFFSQLFPGDGSCVNGNITVQYTGNGGTRSFSSVNVVQLGSGGPFQAVFWSDARFENLVGRVFNDLTDESLS
jgi:hypothetical protein